MVGHVGVHLRRVTLFALVLCLSLSLVVFRTQDAHAADFTMQTGYYIGNGVSGKQITGLGFQPNLVIIKSSTAAGVGMFKTSAMPAANSAFFSAAIDNTASQITILSDGFSVGTLPNVNTVSVLYHWTAFGGSDCSATGNFCIGTYTGTNGNRTIPTGFQPGLVMMKRTSGIGAHFRTNSMPTNRSEYFINTSAVTNGSFLGAFSATGFSVGSGDNTTGAVYNFIAFKSGTTVAEGTYTGTTADNRTITTTGFSPTALFVKNSSSATANNRRAVFSTKHHHGDHTSYVGDAVENTVNFIQLLQTDGFQVGTGVGVNENTQTFYWFGFAGGTATGVGEFSMKTGSYSGTGGTINVSGLGFRPNLVIVKGENAGLAAFRTSVMPGDLTTYLASTAASFTGGIVSLDSNGFTLGTSSVTNTVGVVYHWQAFGGAHSPDNLTGASDFAVGAYYGNGITGRTIGGLPFTPNMVTVKNLSQLGVFTTGIFGNTYYYADVLETPFLIEALTTEGFQVDAGVAVNSSTALYYWFAFRSGGNFRAGNTLLFSGSSVNTTSFRPDLVLVRRAAGAIPAVFRSKTVTGDATQHFLGIANVSNLITSLNGGGFSRSTQNEVTGATVYMVWRETPQNTISTGIVDSGGSPIGGANLPFSEVQYSFGCQSAVGTFGDINQKLRITSATSNPLWTTSIAATNGMTSSWVNGGATRSYDYNDPSGTSPGCEDGGDDADTIGGQLSINPSTATITPEPLCSNTALSLGSPAAFSHGVTNAITLAISSTGANTECYWDITGITMQQSIPAEQPVDTYTLNLTVTTVSN